MHFVCVWGGGGGWGELMIAITIGLSATSKTPLMNMHEFDIHSCYFISSHFRMLAHFLLCIAQDAYVNA